MARDTNYPDNSTGKPKKIEVAPVIAEGRTHIREKKWTDKLISIFVPDDIESYRDWIIYDKIIPGIKYGIVDIVSMALIGEPSGRSGRRKGGDGYTRVSYDRYYEEYRSPRRKEEPRKRQDLRNYENIIFDTYDQADLVLDTLCEALAKYKMVSIGAIYDAAGAKSDNYMHDSYGWYNLDGARVEGDARNGYYIYIPRRPVNLD